MRFMKVFIFATVLFFTLMISTNNEVKAATTKIFVENYEVKADVAPTMEKGRTLIEARSLFEALGLKMSYNAKTKLVIGEKDGLRIAMTINSRTAKVNNKTITLDVPAKIVKGRTIIPLRFVSEYSGADVDWNAKSKEIRVNGVQFENAQFGKYIRNLLHITNKKMPVLKTDLAKLTTLNLRDEAIPERPHRIYFDSLADFRYFTGLTSLDVYGTFTSLESLSKLTNLTSLYVGGAVKTLNGLQNLTKLTHLEVYGDGNINISALNNKPLLTNLVINGVTQEQLSIIGGLTSLQSLSIEQGTFTSIESLKNLTKLHVLELQNTPLASIQAIKYMPDLTRLVIANSNVQSLNGIETLTKITVLSLYNNEIQDLSPLANLHELAILSLENNDIHSVEPLAKLTKLERVFLKGNNIESIESIQQLPTLTYLDY